MSSAYPPRGNGFPVIEFCISAEPVPHRIIWDCDGVSCISVELGFDRRAVPCFSRGFAGAFILDRDLIIRICAGFLIDPSPVLKHAVSVFALVLLQGNGLRAGISPIRCCSYGDLSGIRAAGCCSACRQDHDRHAWDDRKQHSQNFCKSICLSLSHNKNPFCFDCKIVIFYPLIRSIAFVVAADRPPYCFEQKCPFPHCCSPPHFAISRFKADPWYP